MASHPPRSRSYSTNPNRSLTLADIRVLSLKDWHQYILKHDPTHSLGIRALDLWEPLREWFLEEGLALFIPADGDGENGIVRGETRPSIREWERPFDGSYTVIEEDVIENRVHWEPGHVFAQESDAGRHVLIRLLAKGPVDGQSELDVLRFVSGPDELWRGPNHCVRLERELIFKDEGGDMVFGVFGIYARGLNHPPAVTLKEVVACIDQLLEGVGHLHECLIAHRDIAEPNIFINFAGSQYRSEPGGPSFRSSFPVRYYLTHFQCAVRFPAESDPATRLVNGPPAARDVEPEGMTSKERERNMPPEAKTGEPYDPFKADVYSLGKVLLYEFWQLRATYPALIAVLDRMVFDDPAARPTPVEARAGVKAFLMTLMMGDLAAKVEGPLYPH